MVAGRKKGKPNKSTPALKKKMIIELQKSWGIAAPALEKLKVPRTTYEYWMRSDKKFCEEVLSIRENKIDLAESRLVEAANSGQSWAIALIVRTLGKNRGYTEKQEVDLNVTNKEIKFIFGNDEQNKDE